MVDRHWRKEGGTCTKKFCPMADMNPRKRSKTQEDLEDGKKSGRIRDDKKKMIEGGVESAFP